MGDPDDSLTEIREVPPLIDGRYEVVRELGRGGMARVDLARDAELGRVVAIKWLHGDLMDHDTAGQRFRNEARLLAKVEHPNVLACYGTVQDETLGLGLVMEYVDGEDLKEILSRKGAMPSAQVVALGVQLAEALDALHRAGVVHRDLKPANIMVRKDGSPVIMDLGLARGKEITALTKTGHLLGTIAYMAPEVVMGEPYEKSADIFQLGAILFEALTGKRVTPKASVEEVFKVLTRGEWPEVDWEELGVPEHVRAAVMAALAVKPKRRPPSGRVLAGLLQDQSSGAWAPPSLTDSRIPSAWARPSRLQGLALGVLVAGGLVAGAALGVLAMRGGTPREVRWQVVGAALAVSMDASGSEAVRMEVDGEVVDVESRVDGERRQLVYRGLTRDRDRRARIFWPGGEGPLDSFRAGPEPVVGPPRPYRKDTLRLKVSRPCRLSGPGVGENRPVEAGDVDFLAPGTAGALAYSWSVDGVISRGSWTWSAVFRAELARQKKRVGRARITERLLAEREGGPRASFESLRDEFRAVAPWLPRMLSERSLEARERLGIFHLFQEVAVSAQQERILGRRTEVLSSPAGMPGARRHSSKTDFPGSRRNVEIALEPEGGKKPIDEKGHLLIGSAATRSIPIGEYADGAEAATLFWPSSPRKARLARLWIQIIRLPARTRVVLRARESSRWSGELEFFHPDITPEEGSYRGWSSILLPAELWPLEGTELRLEVLPLIREEASLVKLQEARLDWPDLP